MSVQDALAYIRSLREQHGMESAERLSMNSTSLEALVDGASGQKLNVSVDDLRQAHLLDWKMRKARFLSQD